MAYNYSVITKSCFIIDVVIIFELYTKKVTVNGRLGSPSLRITAFGKWQIL